MNTLENVRVVPIHVDVSLGGLWTEERFEWKAETVHAKSMKLKVSTSEIGDEIIRDVAIIGRRKAILPLIP